MLSTKLTQKRKTSPKAFYYFEKSVENLTKKRLTESTSKLTLKGRWLRDAGADDAPPIDVSSLRFSPFVTAKVILLFSICCWSPKSNPFSNWVQSKNKFGSEAELGGNVTKLFSVISC